MAVPPEIRRRPDAGCESPPEWTARTVLHGWVVVVGAGLSVSLGAFDANVATVVLPDIGRDFGAAPDAVQWIVLSYLIPIAALALSAGTWFATAGPRPAMIMLVGGFGAASVLAGLAPSIAVMVAARAAQGVFGAGLFSAAMVVALHALPEPYQPRVIAAMTTAGALGGVGGPALGSVIAAAWGWRWVFTVCAPISALIIMAFLVGIPSGGRLPMPTRQMAIDGALIGVAVASILLALTFMHPTSWLLAVAAVPALVLWWARSREAQVGRLIKTRTIRTLLVGVTLVATAGMGTQFAVSFFARSDAGLTIEQTGFVLALFALSTALFAQVGVPLLRRFGPVAVAAFGFALLAGSIGSLVPLDSHWSVVDLGARVAIIGAAQGLILPALSSAMFGRAPAKMMSEASASMHLVRTLGFAAGPALVIAAWSARDYERTGLQLGLLLSAGLAAVGVPIMLRIHAGSGWARPDKRVDVRNPAV